jgi:hypothetical protein
MAGDGALVFGGGALYAEGVAYHSPELFAERELPWVDDADRTVTLKALHMRAGIV